MSIPPKKSLGQNFLVDDGVADDIVTAASVGSDDHVVEIGPGLGVLTARLAGAVSRVTAVEIDPRLVKKLRHELRLSDSVEVVEADALKFDFAGIGGPVKVVANLPYYISTPIISRLVDARATVRTAVLMLQKEVAERITADPGGKDYGYLSVMVQVYMKAEYLFTVPNTAFDPVPKVDSAVVRLSALDAPAAPCKDYRYFERVVSAAFSQRRKTLRNTLKSSRVAPVEAVERISECGIDPVRRAETLSVAEFAALTDFLFEFVENQ